jgi:hypothetical protein
MPVPRAFQSTMRAVRILSGRPQLSFLASAVAACLFGPTGAVAQCTDSFNTAFVLAGTPPGNPTPGFAYQNVFPLGVGASLNAVVSTMNTVNTAFLSPSSSFVSARGGAQADQLGGGVWGRAVVGTVETKSTTTSTVDTSKAKTTDLAGNNGPVAPVIGTGTCKGILNENYFGYQFGFDLAKLNVGSNGGNFHFGLTAGYINSGSKDVTGESTFLKTLPVNNNYILDSPAGSFKADTQVPFLGLYAVYTQGNFFIDGQVRQDFYLMNFTDPLNGLSNQAQNATGISAGGSMGYQLSLPSNWFIEPSGGVIWSRVHVDDIPTPGSAAFEFSNVGSVKIDDIESILGRFSLRIGMTITDGNLTWQPFFTGTVFHEFASNATAVSTIGGQEKFTCFIAGVTPGCPAQGFNFNKNFNQVLNTSTSRIGTFTQLGIGTATVFGNSGWLAYGRADYRTGENVVGYSFNTGLRYNW